MKNTKSNRIINNINESNFKYFLYMVKMGIDRNYRDSVVYNARKLVQSARDCFRAYDLADGK